MLCNEQKATSSIEHALGELGRRHFRPYAKAGGQRLCASESDIALAGGTVGSQCLKTFEEFCHTSLVDSCRESEAGCRIDAGIRNNVVGSRQKNLGSLGLWVVARPSRMLSI